MSVGDRSAEGCDSFQVVIHQINCQIVKFLHQIIRSQRDEVCNAQGEDICVQALRAKGISGNIHNE